MSKIIINENLNLLYEFYQQLLTPKQKYYFKLYFYENYSLREIAEKNDVSHSAVNSSLKKIIKILELYEQKLMLLKKYQDRIKIYNEYQDNHNKELINKLRAIDE